MTLATMIAMVIAINSSGVWGSDRSLQNPCEALFVDDSPCACNQPVNLDNFGFANFQDPPIYRSNQGLLAVDFDVTYTDPAQTKIGDCPVTLRSYNTGLVGPTLRLRPGDTLDVNLHNRLPVNQGNPSGNLNVPHHPNTTNFHGHGLHVSPLGNSDNVLIAVEPGDDFPIEMNIPADHPPGTFWYHPHSHGSTAVQVGSGMAGVIVIEGGIDTIPEIAQAQEHILIFQQIPYDTQGLIEPDATTYWTFDSYFGNDAWPNLKRYTTVNGQLAPTIHMRPREVQRWRMLHAGVHESLKLILAQNPLPTSEQEELPLHEIAADGLTLGTIDTWTSRSWPFQDGSALTSEDLGGLRLDPGNRSDVLVQASVEPGEYFLYDLDVRNDDSLRGSSEALQIIARVVVEGAEDCSHYICQLPSEQSLDRYIPLPPITDDEITNWDAPQEMVFNFLLSPIKSFTINGRPYSQDENDIRKLPLGKAEIWHLSTAEEAFTKNHPFHIHVNPFQIDRHNPDGQLERIWRDTVLVSSQEYPPSNPLKMRTRYDRYLGEFVLHCHILDHEDQGMMQRVEVVLPNEVAKDATDRKS
ncbi:MAG: multicopper oxidase family protein [Cyanobacteria bacterium P01_E01_bin.34]